MPSNVTLTNLPSWANPWTLTILSPRFFVVLIMKPTNRLFKQSKLEKILSPLKPNPFKGKCQFCRTIGHVISACPKFTCLYPDVVFPSQPYTPRPPSGQPQANLASHVPTTPSRSFLLDSGATHHLTNDLDTLAIHAPYDSLDDLLIGDGTVPLFPPAFSVPTSPATPSPPPPPPPSRTILALLRSIPLRFYVNWLVFSSVPFTTNWDWMKISRLPCSLPWWRDATLSFMASGGYNVASQINQVKQPVLIIWGENDQIISYKLAVAYRRITGKDDSAICGHHHSSGHVTCIVALMILGSVKPPVGPKLIGPKIPGEVPVVDVEMPLLVDAGL
ncbi:hypothetical protein KSS87_008062 [Heliosperma pusillum]|nr:hypothetical protein KSS87_008062 [Heliosperma pusillum]